MTFLEAFIIPVAGSIFANYAPAHSIKTINKLKGKDHDALKKLFTSSLLKTLKSNKSNFISNSNENIVLQLVEEIKSDDTKLFIAIDNLCKNKNKNFLNILESNDNSRQDFTKELFNLYAIDISLVKEGSFYDGIISNLLLNYKQIFLQTLTTESALSVIFQEVLKIDEMKSQLENIQAQLEQSNLSNTLNQKKNATYELFKSVKFSQIEKGYASALACIGLGEKQVSSCPQNNEYIFEIMNNMDLTNVCIIKGTTGTGKSLLTYQVAKKYHENGWNVYKLDKNIFTENPIIENEFEKSIILIDDAQTLSISHFESLVDYANAKCLILFNWNTSTSINSDFLYSYKCIDIVPAQQVEILKKFSLNNIDVISKILIKLNIPLTKNDHFNNVEARIERASREKSPWLFNYVLTDGWRTASNDMELLKTNQRLDMVMMVVAVFQYVTLDDGINIQIIIDEIKHYNDDQKWLKSANKVIKDYCIHNDNLVKHKHYAYAREVLHLFIKSEKDEKINDYVINLFKRILFNNDFEIGYSNILEFIMFDYRYINFFLNNEKVPELVANDLFSKSQSLDFIKIRNLNSLIRFDKNVATIVQTNFDIIYLWIIDVTRDTAYPLTDLVNTLYNEKKLLNITENMMEIVFNKIIDAPLSEKSRYSSLYNRLHLFSKLKQIKEHNKLNIDISNIKLGVAHYHFAKVISDLSYIDKRWANNCIKMNLESIAKNFNEDMMKSFTLYKDILHDTFELIPIMLGIKVNANNKTAKKLADLITVDAVLDAFKSLKLSDTQNFSSLLFFFRIYNKTKLLEISNKIDYEYLKILYKNDFLQEHNHKTIVHGLYNHNSKAYNDYVLFLINNCMYLDDKLFTINPMKSFEKLIQIKKYKMNFHGNDGYELILNILKTLDENNENDLSLKIIRDNENTIKDSILNNISNADNSKDKYDLLVYIYYNIPSLLETIFSDSLKVNSLIKKINTLLRGKNVEKKTAKLYILFIKEFTTKHDEEIKKVEKHFPSIKRSELV